MSIASRKGLLAAAGPDSLVIASTDAVRKAFHADVPANNNVKPFTPQATISIPRLSQLAFSTDETYLAIAAEEGGGLAVYSVDALLQGNQESAFQMNTNGISVRALIANPAPELAHLFAVILTDGKLMVANLQEKQLSNVFREGVSCVSWSAKGKQLVAGLGDGSAVQYDPQGTQKAQIPRPPETTDPMTSICWVTNDEFLTIHTPVSGDSTDSIYHLINRAKGTTNYTAQKLSGDPCPAFGMSRNPAQHYISRLRSFPPNLDEMLIVSSTAAVDIGVVSKASVSLSNDDMANESTVNVFTTTGMAEDTRRAQMPMSAVDGMGDTSPIGMALDLSSKDPVVKPIPQEEMEDSTNPVPALMILNNEGVLCAWWVIYNQSIRQKTVYPGLTSASSNTAPAAQPSSFPSAGTAAPAQSAFGAPSQTQPAFGSTSFGKPAALAFGSPSTAGGAFGGASALGAKTSAWGAPPAGNIASPAFGKATFGSSTPIGGGSAGGFGSASAVGNKTSLWGAPSNDQPKSTPAFGSPSPFGSSSPFSATSGTSGASAFAALGSKSSGAPAFAAPGGESKPTLASPFSSFGNTQAGDNNKPSAFSSFGKASDKPAVTSQPSFGAASTPGSFGAASAIGSKSSPWGAPPPAKTPASEEKEASMSDEDGQTSEDSPETTKPEAPKALFGEIPKQPSFSLGGDQSKSSVFGNTAAPSPKPSSPFAQFGNDKSKTSAFGGASAGSTSPFAQFGNNKPTTSPFASSNGDKPSTSVFGQPFNKTTSSPFGQPSDKTTNSVFGKPSDKPSGIPKFSGFKIGSTFEADKSPKDDPPASKDAGKSMFGSAFGSALGDAAKKDNKLPATPIREEAASKEDEAPLPPDFVTYKPKEVEEDLPPIAGSPPIDLGDKSSLRSSPVSSVNGDEEDEAGLEGPSEDDEEWDDEEEEDEEGEVHDDDEEDDEDDDDEDEEDFNEDDTVSRPPKTEAGNLFGSRLTFPVKSEKNEGRSLIPSTTPAGFPKGPVFQAPTKPQGSPRSPSPVRPAGQPASRSNSRQTLGKQQTAVPPMSSRPSSAAQKQPPKPVEPEAGDLSDEEDARIQDILNSELEPTRTLEPFIAHQNYIGEVNKPGLGGQIEKVYRDINSMVDTLALNVRSLEAFVRGHESLHKPSGRERSDLEDPEDWCLVEVDELEVVEKELGNGLEEGKVNDVKSKLDEMTELYKDASKLHARTSEMRKQIVSRTDPQQRSNHRGSALNTEAQVQQTELRHGVAKVQKLLREAEEALSVLRAELASAPSSMNGTSSQRTPTVEAVTNTILKMTAMIEQKSGDVDVLEAQIRRLPVSLAGLSLEDETDVMRSSVRSLNGRPGNSGFSTPPAARNRYAATPLGMSGMFGSRIQTPQTNRKSQSTYGLTYSPDASAELSRSTRSLTGSTRKKMSDVSSEEVNRYLAKQSQRKKILAALKETVEKRGTRVTHVEK